MWVVKQNIGLEFVFQYMSVHFYFFESVCVFFPGFFFSLSILEYRKLQYRAAESFETMHGKPEPRENGKTHLFVPNL